MSILIGDQATGTVATLIKGGSAMRRISLLCAMAGVLTGCAVPAFVAPTGDNTVKLEVRPSLPPDAAVSLFTYENGLTCANRQFLNGGTPSAGGSTSQTRLQDFDTRLKADAVQTLDGFFSQGRFYCRVAVSFYPQKNKIYTVRPTYGDGKCFVLVFDTTASVGGVLEKTLTKRVTGSNPLTEAGPWCMPMAESVMKDKLKGTSSSNDILEGIKGRPRSGGQDGARGQTLDDLQGLLPSSK